MEAEKEPIESALVWAVESADSIIELIDEIRASVVAVKESLKKKEDPHFSRYDLADAVSKADDLSQVLCHLSLCLKESPIPPSPPKKQDQSELTAAAARRLWTNPPGSQRMEKQPRWKRLMPVPALP